MALIRRWKFRLAGEKHFCSHPTRQQTSFEAQSASLSHDELISVSHERGEGHLVGKQKSDK